MLVAACGPGRKAAWDEGSKKLKDSPEAADTTTAEAEMPAEDAALRDKAEAAWAERSERTKLQEAIDIWTQLTKKYPDNTEFWTQLARAHYLMGDGHHRLAGEADAMLEAFDRGVDAGERAMMAASNEFSAAVKEGKKVEEAVDLLPKSAQPAIYWYASNLGKFAVNKGFTTTLYYKDRIFEVMQHVLQLDEKFFHAAPHRYFGVFYAKAPSFAGGDMQKSKEHFDKALSIDDRYLGTKVLYAKYYAVKSDNEELYKQMLQSVVDADPTVIPELTPEQKIEQTKAERLLQNIDETF